MKTANLSLSLVTALALSLSACSKTEAPAPAVAAGVSTSSYDTVAATGKGFSVGALMSAQTVYVLFDPQCPHCAHLWKSSVPLHNRVKFVWIPVAFNPEKSLPQAAALLQAVNPVETMTAHEESLLSGKGGMAAPSSVPADLVLAIKANTKLLSTLGADSVPFILAKNPRTGQVVSNAGAMETAALAQLLGLD